MTSCPNHPECGCTGSGVCDGDPDGADMCRAILFWLALAIVAAIPPIIFLCQLGAFGHAR